MKTLLKLIILLTTFGFATASAALTADEKAAIILIVTNAVATGNEANIKTALNNQIALYPEIAADIVTAALNVPGVSDPNKKLIVRVAAFTAPDELVAIKGAINGFSDEVLNDTTKADLILLATNSSNTGKAILNAANGNSSNSNTNKSLVSFN
jgi:hypothetical protein